MKRLIALLMVLVAFLEGSRIAFALPVQRGWTMVFPSPPPMSLFSVTFGNGVWVAVGEHGTVVRSNDGLRWDLIDSGTTYGLSDVTFGMGQFIAVGAAGIILSSPDGESWIPRAARHETSLSAVVYGENQLVAVGSSGTLATSSDGMTWTFSQTSSLRGARDVTYGNGRYVAVGKGMKAESTDGTGWTATRTTRLTTDEDWFAVAFGNGEFLAAGAKGAVAASRDGTAWRAILSGRESYDIGALIFADGQFRAVGYQPSVPGGDSGRATILSSSDGESWSAQAAGIRKIYSISSSEGRYIAVGQLGTVLVQNGSGFWEQQRVSDPVHFHRVVFQNNRFFALGDQGRVATSEDGVHWGEQTVWHGSYTFRTVVFAQGRYLMPEGNGPLFTSNNGRQWDLWGNSPTATGDMAYGSGVFVGTYNRGAGQPLMITTDPLKAGWQALKVGGIRELSRVLYGATRFVAIGPQGAVVSSVDGRSWTVQETGTSADLSGITYGKGLFVAVGDDGIVLTSPDGNEWARKQINTRNLIDVAYGDGLFVAVGAGTVHWSEDGVQWQSACLPTAQSIQSLTFGNGRFVAVGPNRSILSATAKELTSGILERADLIGSSLTASSAEARANGSSGVQLEITLLNQCGEPLPGREVRIQSFGSPSTVDHSSAVTDSSGRASFVASSTTPGTVNFSAVVGPDGTAMLETAVVTFRGCTSPFADVASAAEACPAIADLVARKAVGGFPDGTFRPDNPVTRAEFAKMLVIALGRSPAPSRPVIFKDASGHWSASQGFLQAVYELGAISGFPDGNFHPDEYISRVQIVKMMAAASGLAPGDAAPYADVPPSHWASGWVAAAIHAKLIGRTAPHPIWGEAHLRPEEVVSRAEAAMLLANQFR